jgi:acyl-CoA thioester hydrolase
MTLLPSVRGHETTMFISLNTARGGLCSRAIMQSAVDATDQTYRSDNDVYHHMNNSVYAFLIDSIVNAYLIDKCGMDPQSSKQVGLVVNSYCDFFGSVAYPSVVDLGLRAVNLGKSSVKYEVGIFEQGKEDVRAVGGSIHVFVEQDGRRPAKDGMEPKMRKGLAKLLGNTIAKL